MGCSNTNTNGGCGWTKLQSRKERSESETKGGEVRKGNEWEKASSRDSKNSDHGDPTVSSKSLPVVRDHYRVAAVLAGCDERLTTLLWSFIWPIPNDGKAV
jgi:hypothetical protein